MAAIVSTLEVDRLPEEVFAFVTDPAHFAEWQSNVVRGWMRDGAASALGAHYTTVRRVGPREQTSTAEITEYDPPRRWAARGIDGPIRALARVNVEPTKNGAGSRVTTEVDFEGRGIGMILVPLMVRRQAQKETPINRQKLLERLAGGKR